VRRFRRLLGLTVAAGVALGVLAGCHVGGSSGPDTAPPAVTVTEHASPQPTRTLLRGFHTLRAGRSATIEGAGGAAMFIKAAGPSVSRNRLSPSYGYAPAHGYYITFKITIKDVGSSPIVIQRLDFWVVVPGLGKINTNEGNAPFSGSPRQLDTTELTSGGHVSNNLTFDVSHPSGTLYYGPGGHKPTIAWRFS
jgi:hypothetical protein